MTEKTWTRNAQVKQVYFLKNTFLNMKKEKYRFGGLQVILKPWEKNSAISQILAESQIISSLR